LYEAVIVTVVFVDTVDVMIANEPVNPVAGTVTLAGTLATRALLLESETTAPPSGAPTLRITVPEDASPPATVDGLADKSVSVAGGGGSCGVKLRTADQAPAVPPELTPRTRQKCVTVARPVVG
jgi:hypothetical protein